MNRKAWDQLVSTAALVIAVVLVLMGAAAIYGGNFGRDNVTDRLTPQNDGVPAPRGDDRRGEGRRSATSPDSRS